VRVGRVVLTTCDAFEVFPPPLFSYLKWLVPLPLSAQIMGGAMLAFPALRRLSIAFGRLAKRPIDDALTTQWLRPLFRDPAIRRDLQKFVRGVSPDVTQAVGRELANVKKPFLLVWTPEDRLFPMSLCDRLAKTLPDARVVTVPDAYTFVQEDQPEALARAIRGCFADAPHKCDGGPPHDFRHL